jgi:hypothetical protein
MYNPGGTMRSLLSGQGSIVAAIPSFASALVTSTVILQMDIAGYVFLLGRMEPI